MIRSKTIDLTEELILNVDVMLGISNEFTVGILNAMLNQDSTAPITTAPDDLCVYCTLLASRLA
jgi:hypothetical protein